MVSLPVGYNILLLLAAILAGVCEWRRLTAGGVPLAIDGVVEQSAALSRGVPLVFFCLLAFLVFTAVVPLAPGWFLPLWVAYYRETLMWGTLLVLGAFVFTVGAVVAFHTRHRDRWKVVSGGVGFLLAFQGAQWFYTRPVAPDLTHAMTTDGVILQSSGVSCAAASGANIARALGRETTEKEMAALFGTTKRLGTADAQVVYGMRTLGFIADRVEIPGADPAQLASLAMLFVDHPDTGPESHAVAFMRFAHDQAEIWDPLVGKRFLTRSQLAATWHGRGILVTMPGGPR